MDSEYAIVQAKRVSNVANYTFQVAEIVFCETNNALYYGDKNNVTTLIQGGSDYILPIATASALGGVKISSRLTINGTTGALSADVQSTNDFTTALKNKLDGIEASATKYPDTGEEVYSTAEKNKLNNIEDGATAPRHKKYVAFLTQVSGKVVGFGSLVGGTGYSATTGVNTSGGNGTGLTLDITTDLVTGTITEATINQVGQGYGISDVVTIIGGNNDASITITEIDNDPTVTTFENSLGCSITWSTTGTGEITGESTIDGAFTTGVITVLLNPNELATPGKNSMIFFRADNDRVRIITFSDISYTTPANNILLNTPIEIRIYPEET